MSILFCLFTAKRKTAHALHELFFFYRQLSYEEIVPGSTAAAFEGAVRRAKTPSIIDKHTFLHKQKKTIDRFSSK